MKSKTLISIDDVYKIKASGNSDRTIAAGVKIKDLPSKSYQEKVEVFQLRIQKWFFDTMRSLSKDTNEETNFVLTAISCVLIDLFSQYRYGEAQSSKASYTKFFEDYLSEQNHKINPPIKSCNFRNDKWEEIEITSVAEGFYLGFRCGILHSARIMEYGRINRYHKDEIIKVLEWNPSKKTKEINVHAPALFMKLEKIFKEYIKVLKEEKSEEYKINFLKRYNFEYGIIEQYNGADLMIK